MKLRQVKDLKRLLVDVDGDDDLSITIDVSEDFYMNLLAEILCRDEYVNLELLSMKWMKPDRAYPGYLDLTFRSPSHDHISEKSDKELEGMVLEKIKEFFSFYEINYKPK